MLINILFLAYWSFIWFKSYRKHRDKISLVVFLFVAQGFIKELWFVISESLIAINGLSTGEFASSLLIVRVLVIVMLISIQIIVGRLNDEANNEDNDR